MKSNVPCSADSAARIAFDEDDVGQPERADRALSGRDGGRREIAADEMRRRHRHRHRDEVGAIVAAHLEDAATRQAGRDVPDPGRDRGETRRVRRSMRQRVVRNVLVAARERDIRGVDA
jgi:hypothetical protein